MVKSNIWDIQYILREIVLSCKSSEYMKYIVELWTIYGNWTKSKMQQKMPFWAHNIHKSHLTYPNNLEKKSTKQIFETKNMVSTFPVNFNDNPNFNLLALVWLHLLKWCLWYGPV